MEQKRIKIKVISTNVNHFDCHILLAKAKGHEISFVNYAPVITLKIGFYRIDHDVIAVSKFGCFLIATYDPQKARLKNEFKYLLAYRSKDLNEIALIRKQECLRLKNEPIYHLFVPPNMAYAVFLQTTIQKSSLKQRLRIKKLKKSAK